MISLSGSPSSMRYRALMLALIFVAEIALIGIVLKDNWPRRVCAGVEGMALVTLFVTLYLVLFRRDLRLPHVLLLYPVGIVRAAQSVPAFQKAPGDAILAHAVANLIVFATALATGRMHII